MSKQRSTSILSPLSSSVMLWSCLQRHRKLADKLLKPHDLSFRELAALSILTDEMESVVFAQNIIGQYLGISDATTSRLVMKLRKKHLISFTPEYMFDTRANILATSPVTLNYLDKYSTLLGILDAHLEAELGKYGIIAPELLNNQKVKILPDYSEFYKWRSQAL